MARKIVVKWQDLENNHFSHIGFRRRLENVYPDSWSPCCIQVSHAMNNAGLEIDPRDKTLRKQMVYKNKIYLINVPSVLKYFAEQGYEKEVYKGSQAEVTEALRGRRGIILFGTMHADLWLGENIHRPHEYRLNVLWGDESTRALGVSFFEVIDPLDNPFADEGGADSGHLGYFPEHHTSSDDGSVTDLDTSSDVGEAESLNQPEEDGFNSEQSSDHAHEEHSDDRGHEESAEGRDPQDNDGVGHDELAGDDGVDRSRSEDEDEYA